MIKVFLEMRETVEWQPRIQLRKKQDQYHLSELVRPEKLFFIKQIPRDHPVWTRFKKNHQNAVEAHKLYSELLNQIRRNKRFKQSNLDSDLTEQDFKMDSQSQISRHCELSKVTDQNSTYDF